MQDDLTIPSPTYRVPRHAGGMDPGTRRLALIAAGIGGVLVVIVGGWHMVSQQQGGVPVVQAESGPMRVKPANPGGLQVPGIGNDIFSGGNDTTVEKLAPAPQTPDPQALQAMTAAPPSSPAAPPAAAASPAPAPAPVAHAAPPTPAQAAREAASAPERAAAVAATVPSPHPDDRSAPAVDDHAAGDHAAGGHPVAVQLAALSTEDAARAEWARMVHRWPDLLNGRHPAVTRIAHDGHVFWRLRTGGFEDRSAATAFCERLRAKGGGCSVADF